MDTSELIDSAPRFNQVKTDRLFYGQYRYMVRFRLAHMSCLRNPLNTWDDYKDMIENKLDYRTRSRMALGGERRTVNSVPSNQYTRYLYSLLDLGRLLFDLQNLCKLIVAGDFGYLYTNQPQCLFAIKTKSYLDYVLFREAHITKPQGVITLTRSDYCYRTYLKNRYITEQARQHIVNYFTSNQTELRMGPALENWVTGKNAMYRNHWLQPHFFMDHSRVSEPTMLNLVCTDIVRATLPIVVLNS